MGALAVIALGFLLLPPLAHAPARLVAACVKWVGVAVILELLSMLGFVLLFALVFGTRLSTRQRLGTGLRALGAITVLPAGGLVGPAVAARTASGEAAPLPGLTRSTIALTILTNAPGLLVLGGLGFSLGLGWPRGPHSTLLTLPEAGIALTVVAGGWLIGRSSQPLDAKEENRVFTRGRYLVAGVRQCREGASEARQLLSDRDWKLAGAVGYYALDNAVLWAAFHAYGRGAPAISVIVMGYLVGSLGTALPLPAGIGAVEGGLIGALVLYGAPAAPAAGAVLLYRGISLSLPVVLGAVAWGLVPVRWLRSPGHRRS